MSTAAPSTMPANTHRLTIPLGKGLASLAMVGAGVLLGTMFVPQPQDAIAQQSGQVGIVGGAGTNGSAPEPQGLLSAADQRKTIIDELRSLNSRMERVESLLSKGLTVKVSEMPTPRERPEERAEPRAK